MEKRLLLLATICVLGLVGSTNAAVINVDIFDRDNTNGYVPPYTGVAAAPDAGTYWNQFDIRMDYFPSTVYASDGTTAAPAGFNVSILGGGNTAFHYYDGTGIAPELMGKFTYSNNGTGWTVVINGLTAGGQYDLYWYQQNGVAASATGSFTFGGVTKTATNTGQRAALIEDDNYVYFSSLVADGTGSISGTIGSTAQFGGFQIVEVPEPATMVLLTLGSVAGLIRRRK